MTDRSVPAFAKPVPWAAKEPHIDDVLAGDYSALGPLHGPEEQFQHVIERIRKHYERGGFEVKRWPIGDAGAWLPMVILPADDLLERVRLLKHHRTFDRGLSLRLYAEGALIVPTALEKSASSA